MNETSVTCMLVSSAIKNKFTVLEAGWQENCGYYVTVERPTMYAYFRDSEL